MPLWRGRWSWPDSQQDPGVCGHAPASTQASYGRGEENEAAVPLQQDPHPGGRGESP